MQLSDLGRVTKETHGQVNQPFLEGGLPPFNKWAPYDAGRASQVTKGVNNAPWFELAPPPFTTRF